MKKKLLAILLSLVAVVAFAGVAVTASAAGTKDAVTVKNANFCLLYTSPSPRDEQ